MRWPWQQQQQQQPSGLDKRAVDYSDAYLNAIFSQIRGQTLAVPSATAALESCAGTVGRAFMAAEVTGRPALTNALSPSSMELIGRSLIRRGEVLFMIEVSSGTLRLLPAEHWDVDGQPDPTSWWYRVTLGGPSNTVTYSAVPSTSVLHFRYAVDAQRPWHGNSPLMVAALAGRLSANTINSLADEAGGPVGRILGIPTGGDDDSVAPMKRDIAEAKGRMAFVESGDWDNVGEAESSLKSFRFGPEPSRPLIEQAKLASAEVMSACGFNPALFQAGDAASLREAYRIGLAGVIQPLSKLVQGEIAEKLDSGISIGFVEARAADLTGRARAVQSLVGAGMPLADARAVAGI